MAKKNMESVEGNSEGKEEKVSKVLEMENQALFFIKRAGNYNRDRRRRDFFDASVTETGIHFWRTEAVWDTVLQMVDYIVTGDIACQHSE